VSWENYKNIMDIVNKYLLLLFISSTFDVGPVKSHCSQGVSYCLTLCGPRDQNLLAERGVIELDNL